MGAAAPYPGSMRPGTTIVLLALLAAIGVAGVLLTVQVLNLQ